MDGILVDLMERWGGAFEIYEDPGPQALAAHFDKDVTFDPALAESLYGRGITLGNANSNTLYRLREGIERFLITDINNPGAGVSAQ